MDAFVGIDPGAKGAICVLTPENKQCAFYDTSADIPEILNYLIQCERVYTVRTYTIEDVHSIFGTSAKSNFNFGFNVGKLHGMFAAIRKPLHLVQPKAWQKVVGVTVKGSKLIKQQVGELCRTMYPSCDIYGKRGGLLDGRSDSLMIAHYSYKMHKANKLIDWLNTGKYGN